MKNPIVGLAVKWLRLVQRAITTVGNRIDPNAEFSQDRYSFGVGQHIVLGTPCGITVADSPATPIKTDKISINAPCPGFVEVHNLQFGLLSVTVGGTEDASHYSADAQLPKLKLPWLMPWSRATFCGSYTGMVPPGYKEGQKFFLSVRFDGRCKTFNLRDS